MLISQLRTATNETKLATIIARATCGTRWASVLWKRLQIIGAIVRTSWRRVSCHLTGSGQEDEMVRKGSVKPRGSRPTSFGTAVVGSTMAAAPYPSCEMGMLSLARTCALSYLPHHSLEAMTHICVNFSARA